MSTDIVAVKPPKAKPHTVVNADGLIAYRTKCLTFDIAARFAKCLEANARFEDVGIKRSMRALGAKVFYVHYFASNPQRQVTLAEREQLLREERAASSGPAYQYFRDPDNPNLFFLLSDSGEVYELIWSGASFASCNCPDSTKGIARRLLLICKHRIDANKKTDLLIPTVTPQETPEERRARIMRDRDLDFPD